jgi:hypothetical protein
LREVVDRAQIDQLLLRARSSGAAWGKPCPRCTKRGREARVRDARRLYVLDWCEPCEVLWFDVEELEGFVPQLAEPRSEEPPSEEPPPASPAPVAPRPRRAASGPSSSDIVAELAGDIGIEALLALLAGFVD